MMAQKFSALSKKSYFISFQKFLNHSKTGFITCINICKWPWGNKLSVCFSNLNFNTFGAVLKILKDTKEYL